MDNEEKYEYDFDCMMNKAIADSLKRNECPDCGEKINSKQCCCYGGE